MEPRSRRPAQVMDGGYICFSGHDWWYHNRAHSDFQIMRRLARDTPVLLVNSIGMRMPLPGQSSMFYRRILRKVRSVAKYHRQPVPALPGFHVVTPLLLPIYGNPRARGLNAALVRVQVVWLARRLGIDPAVCVVTLPSAWEVVKEMEPAALVVSRPDKYSAFGETDTAYVAQQEEALLRHADRVVYVSGELMAAEKHLTDDRAVFLDHGVDLGLFTVAPDAPEPALLRDVPRPRVGFFGGLDDYLVDFGLLARVAREIPEAQLVLIGDATCSLRELERLPNVHILGHRPHEEIPRLGSGFDVALMPWLDNEWIRHSNPIKLKEYLALGLPVVSTDFPEVHRYADVVDIARDHDQFIDLVRAALAGEHRVTPAQRRARVVDDTWDRRVDEFRRLCEDALAHRHERPGFPAAPESSRRFVARVGSYWRELRAYRREAVTFADFLKVLRVRMSLSKVGPLVCRRPVTVRVDLRGLGPAVYLRSHTTDISVLNELVEGDAYGPVAAHAPADVRTIVDLGANTGLAARWFLRRYPEARIVCVEPEPENVRTLRQNVASHSDRVSVVPRCIGGSERQVGLRTDQGAFAYRMVELPPNGGGDAVDVVRMETVLDAEGIERVDLLKCDIEGAEQELFESCEGWIDRVQTLTVECHGPFDSQALERNLRRHGGSFTVVHRVANPEFDCEIATLRRTNGT